MAGVVLVLLVGTAAGTLLTPPTYRASGLLEVRRGNADMERRETLFPRQDVTEEYLQTQYGILESKAVARRVVETLGLDTARTGDSGTAETADPKERQAIVEEIRGGLEVDPREGSRLVRVSYEAADPELAADVVNAALYGYVDVRVQAGQEIVSWLSRQVDSTKAELQRSKRELRAYAREHDLPTLKTADGEAGGVVDQRLRELEQELTRVRAKRIAAESRYRQVVGGSGPQSVDNRVIQDLLVELASLRKEYARLTTLFQESYPKAREVKRQIEELEDQLKQEKSRVADRLQSELQVARRQEELLQEAIDEQRELGRRMADESGQYRLLRREVETTRKLLAAFQQTRKEAEVSAALREARFGIVDMAVPPRGPVGPGLKQNLALALVAGLVLGVGAAFLRERLDGELPAASGGAARVAPPLLELITEPGGASDLSLRPREELPAERILPGLQRASGDEGLTEPGTGSYRALATELFQDGDAAAPTSILVTSCQAREGGSTVSVNLARALAASGRRTLLVDGDLRRPSLQPSSLGETPGLCEHLTEGIPWKSLVLSQRTEGLDLLPAGCADGNASEALASGRMQRFLAEAERAYDCVLLDSAALFVDPPDARILFSLVDGVLVVRQRDGTPRALVRRVLEKAPKAWGVVVGRSGAHG